MRTVVFGPITRDVLEDAALMAGIVPTVLVISDVQPVPDVGLPVEVLPICRMLDHELAVRQRNYTLCLSAEAVILTDGNEHLAGIAKKYGYPVYES